MDKQTADEAPGEGSTTGKPKKRWWLRILVVLALLVGGGWYVHHRRQVEQQAGADQGASAGGRSGRSGSGAGGGSGRGRGGDPNRPTPVRVAAATQHDVDVLVDALGTVTSGGTAVVRVRVDGLLQRVLFTEGQPVAAGQLLAQIDPRPFEVALAQVQGQMARDQALLTNARVDLARYEDLVRQDAAPRQQLDSQKALVAQYEGTLRVDQASVDNARLQLGYTRVTAPVSGRIGLRQVDAGNMVKAGDTNGLATITQVQPIAVLFSVPQDQLRSVLRAPQAGVGLPVMARDRAGSQVLARGTLASVDNQIDPTTGTVKLKAQFANQDSALFPNQFVNIALRVDRLQAVPMVAEAAVQRGAPGTFVYVAGDDGTAKVRPVKTGPRESGRVAVLEGLKVGERVVVEGADKLRDGGKIEVVTGDPMAAASAASGASRPHGGKRRARP